MKRQLLRDQSTRYGTQRGYVLMLNQTEKSHIHSSLDNDKNLVLSIIAECKEGNFHRFEELYSAGIEWVRHYTVVSDKTWAQWRRDWKIFRKKAEISEVKT